MIFSYLPHKTNENFQTILPSIWAIIGGLLLRAVFPKVKPKLQPEGEKRKGFFAYVILASMIANLTFSCQLFCQHVRNLALVCSLFIIAQMVDIGKEIC